MLFTMKKNPTFSLAENQWDERKSILLVSESDVAEAQIITHPSKDNNFEISVARKRHFLHCAFPGCDLSFTRRDAFDRHEYIHHRIKKYACGDCDSKYITQSHLTRHTRKSHQIYTETKTKCRHESCAMEFTSTSGMKRHYRQRHLKEKLYGCKECQEKFYRKSQLKLHSIEHTGVFPYICDKCGHGSANLKSHEHHMVSHKSYQCTICGETVAKWSLLMVHRRDVHSKKHECNVCKKIFSHKSNMESHMRVHSADKNVFTCNVLGCEKFYFHAKNLKAHIRCKHNHERLWECYRCHRILSTKQKMHLHLKFHDMLKAKKVQVKRESITKDRPTHLRNKRGINSRKVKSTAAMLTGVITAPIVEKMIINGDGKLVEIVDRTVEVVESSTEE